MRHCEPIWGADTFKLSSRLPWSMGSKLFIEVTMKHGLNLEMKLSTNEWLGWCSKHFLNKYCLLIRINFVRWTTQHQQILSMKNQSYPDFFRGLYSLNCQRFSTIVHYQFEINLGFFVWGMEACSIKFFLHWSICMRYFGFLFLAIAVQNQAKFECNSTTPNNRNTSSNCINLTASAILSSKQISNQKRFSSQTTPVLCQW